MVAGGKEGVGFWGQGPATWWVLLMRPWLTPRRRGLGGQTSVAVFRTFGCLQLCLVFSLREQERSLYCVCIGRR